MRCYPAETFEGLLSDGLITERMTNVMRYMGFPPVCELMIMLIALTPVPRGCPLYAACSKSRWAFLEEMLRWKFLHRICEVIAHPEEHCYSDSYVNDDQHSTAASQLFLEVVEKLSLEEQGEVLLQPIGEGAAAGVGGGSAVVTTTGTSVTATPTNTCSSSQSTSLIDILVDAIVLPPKSGQSITTLDGIRRSSARMLCFLLRRAADIEILCYTHHPNGSPPTTTFLPNRLFGLRESIVNHTRNRLGDLMHLLQTFDENTNNTNNETTTTVAAASYQHGGREAIKFTTYTLAIPFTALRAMVIEVVVLMVESEETIASSVLSKESWKMMIMWAIKYAHNNVYHALFYRLVFAVLR